MKALILLIASTLFLAAPAYAEVEFPFELPGPGEFSLEVPAGDTWKVFNKEAYMLVQLKFADYKLQLEEIEKLHEVELNYLIEVHAFEIQNLNEVFQLKVDYFENKITTLEDRNKKLKKAASGTILGIHKGTLWFAFGAFAMAQAMASN